MFGLLSNQFTSCVSCLSSRRLHPFSNRFKSPANDVAASQHGISVNIPRIDLQYVRSVEHS